MTKLFQAISNHGHLLGGGEHSFIDLLTHLPPLWRSVAVVPEAGEVASRIEAHGIDLRIIPLPPIRPWNAFQMIKSVRLCAHLCEAVGAKFIYANGSRAAFYGGMAGHMSRRPVIWHCRMTGRDFYLDPVTTRLSDIIVANSAATARRFRGSGAGKVRVVHNGVNLEWLREKPIGKPDSIRGHWEVILVVARISKWKRHDLALAAFEHIAPLRPSAHLVCVGAQDLLDSQWWAFLQEKSLRSRYSNRIHWIGPVDDIRPWYRAASLLLLPSMNEPFGRVAVEAMALGVPVVAMRSGGIPEIVRHGEDGLLVSHANGSELGSACLQLLGDAPLRERLAHSSKRRAERFTLEGHVKKMAEVFEEALG